MDKRYVLCIRKRERSNTKEETGPKRETRKEKRGFIAPNC